ncbi:RING-H2 finger protein ATL22-like [Mercurialis annua]|uniref:RING-H2 finger protein ATL22-like n=1 Tax=Mercurialis annua TaxID=3986 RepID=UPI00215E547E|nr:RING-H2 finger protein ATL22-like [Mercurialis annua]
MDSSIFLYALLLSTIFLTIEGFQETHCHAIKCSTDNSAPEIRFPFQESTRQNPCGFPGFELSCKENKTVIDFPNYGELGVKSIDYEIKKLDLVDFKNCVHEVFLNLDLSLTQFQYYYIVKNYTYLNCSAPMISSSFAEIPCLSGSGFHVYTVDPSSVVPDSCVTVKTVAIPFSFSPYLADNSFGLGLTWSLPEYQETQIQDFSIKNVINGDKFLKIVLCILAVTLLVSIKKNQSKKVNIEFQNRNLKEGLVCCKTQDNSQSSMEEGRI